MAIVTCSEVSLEHRHPPPPLGEADRGGGAGRAAARDGDVVIEAGIGRARGVHDVGGVQGARQYTSRAFT